MPSSVIEKLKLSMIFVDITLQKMTSKLWLFYIILALTISFPLSFAQHHSGQQAPPISFGMGEVTVSTSLIPADFTPEKYSNANLLEELKHH